MKINKGFVIAAVALVVQIAAIGGDAGIDAIEAALETCEELSRSAEEVDVESVNLSFTLKY